MGFDIVTAAEVQLDKQGILPDVRRYTFELECLEASPSKQSTVGRSEFQKAFCDIFPTSTVRVIVGGRIHGRVCFRGN